MVHDGGNPIERLDDTDYLNIAEWIALEDGGGEGIPDADLSELERLFARRAMPALVARRCMTANCHGPSALLSTLPLKPPPANLI